MDKSQAAARENYAGRSLEELGLPERDHSHLLEGIQAGGVVIAVSEIAEHVGEVERIFGKHQANKIDEAVTRETAATPVPVAAPTAEGTVIPVVEEELAVGKRTVDRGGVRVYRRVVEVPVEQTVQLREEHVTVDRVPANRAATEQDLALGNERTIELTETAEQAVIGKSARVVEEVLVGKEESEHVEHIQDSVRRTEIDVEPLSATTEAARTGTASPAASDFAGTTANERDITRGGL